MKFLISTLMRTVEPRNREILVARFPPDSHPEAAYIDIEKMRWSDEKEKFSLDPFDMLFTPVMTDYVCSYCGERIPIMNVFVHPQTWLQRLRGTYTIAGFWCPCCGDPWTRCERVPPKITIIG